MWKCSTVQVVVFLALVSSSQAQSDSNRFALVGVLLVCGGVVVIVCLIWVGICYGLWVAERDLRKFKKRQGSAQSRQYQDRQIQEQQQSRARDASRQPSILHHPPTPQTDHRYQQIVLSEHSQSPHTHSEMVQSNSSPHASSRTSALKKTHQTNQFLSHTNNKLSHSPSSANGKTTQPRISPSSSYGSGPPSATHSTLSTVTNRSGSVPHIRKQDHTLGSRASDETTQKKGDHTKHVKFNSKTGSSPQWRDQRREGSDVRMQHSQPGAQGAVHQKREEQKQAQDEYVSSHFSTQPMPRPGSIQRVVLGYSPQSLREVEEVDVELDSDQSPPRYSWLFHEKKKGAALSEGTSPYTFHTHASPLSVSSTPTGKGVVGGGGSEKAGATDMAVYGQLTSWPQLK